MTKTQAQAAMRNNELVAVNNIPNGQLYRISKLNGNNATLTYTLLNNTTKTVQGGTLDICYLQAPTAAQLSNGKEI